MYFNNEEEEFIKFGSAWLRPAAIKRIQEEKAKLKHEIIREEAEREERFKKIYNSSFLDLVYKEFEANAKFLFSPIEKAFYKDLKNQWFEDVINKFKDDREEDFLKLSETEAKEKIRDMTNNFFYETKKIISREIKHRRAFKISFY